MDAHRKNLLELNVAVLLWAGTALFAKWIALSAYQITALRSAVAAAALFAVLGWQRQSLRTANRQDLGIMLAGGVAMGVHWGTYFQSIQISTVAIGILSLHTYPVMTALAEPLVFGERLHWLDVLLALMVFLGVAVLVPSFSLDNAIARGVLLGVLSAACFTARNVLSRRVVAVYGGMRVTFYQLLAAAGAFLPVVLLTRPAISVRASGQVLLLGILFTALPHVLYANSLVHLKARSVGVIATLLPVYGTVTAAIFLGELPGTRTVVGGAIILVAAIIETVRVLQRPASVLPAER